MADIYDTLIGAAPTDAEQQAAVAQMLRRRRNFGELGALTGDKVLQPFGGNMIKQADDYAGQIQDTRQRDTAHKLQGDYQTGQLGHMAGTLAETTRNNNLEHEDRQAQIAAMLEAAGIKAAAKGAGHRKMTDNTRNTILSTVDTYTGVDSLLKTFKPEYTQRLGAGPQSALPNAMARVGIGTEGSKEAAQWWAAWNEVRTLPERNRLFGATLTPNEKSEWDKVDLNPNMSPEQITVGVNRIKTILLRHASNRARGMVKEGFDPEMINEYYQDMFNGDNAEDVMVTDENHGAINRGPGQEKTVTVTMGKDGKLEFK